MNTENKLTYVKALEIAIACEALPTEVREKLTALCEQQTKRNHSDNNKPTAKQIERTARAEALYEAMRADGGSRTVTEWIAIVYKGEVVSTQAVVGMLNILENRVEREIIKRRAYYRAI